MSTIIGNSHLPSPAPSLSISKITRGHSCVSCQRRKVRCNGQKPCSSCTKTGVECVTVAHSPLQQRKARLLTPKEDGGPRRRRLRANDMSLRDGPANRSPDSERMEAQYTTEGESSSPKSNTRKGTMIFERGHQRYIENNLWTGISDELQSPKDALNGSSEEAQKPPTGSSYPSGESFIFGRPMPNTLRSSHPQPVNIFRLWQTYLDNVNPLAKIFHAPMIQQLVLEASCDLDNVSVSTEALMFSIYLSSVTSLRDEDCRGMFGESRAVLLTRFSNATQQALINAEVLKTSSLVILQAFTLFLLSMRQLYDPQSLWALTGLAVRIGQRMGLHRENTRGLSVFEAEIRRRLWWQIIILDSRSARLAAVALDTYHHWDTKRPLNVNDSDLDPNMKELPVEHTGVTEMLFCSIRYEIGEYMMAKNKNGQTMSAAMLINQEDKAIDELENRLEQNFLRYCDLSISFHLLANYMARSSVCHMRLTAHHPGQYPDTGVNLPQDEKDMLFSLSLKTIEYDNSVHATKGLDRYLWHVNIFFPFEAFIYILSELPCRSERELETRAWRQVHQSYDHHPNLIMDRGNVLYVAIGNLAVKAWEKTGGGARNYPGLHQATEPPFISTLRSQRNIKEVQVTQSFQDDSEVRSDESPNGGLQTGYLDQGTKSQWVDMHGTSNSALPPSYDLMDTSAMDWEYWQGLLEGQGLPVLEW